MTNTHLHQVNRPIFSVIMPTFNRANTVTAAIQSLQAQKLTSWELIAINDGSTDETHQVVSKMAESDARIRLLTQKNQGAALARNFGISEARGEFLAFLDSDDTLTPNHLELRLNAFSEMNIDLIYGPANIIGNPMVIDTNNPTRMISLNDESVKICGTFAIRTAQALRIGGFPNLKYSEDGEFFTKALRFGLKAFRLGMKTYNYDRTSPDSISTQLLQLVTKVC